MAELHDDADEALSPSAERVEVVSKLAELILAHNALRFPAGAKKFTLKSGRHTSYYLDIAALCAGHDMFELGKAFGVTLRHHFGEEVDVLLAAGTAAIPSAVTATHYYALLTGHATEWAYIRPTPDVFALRPLLAGAEVKLERRVVIVDDILTTGVSLRAAIALAKATDATVVGAVVLVDRRERVTGNRYAASEITRETGVKVVSCATVGELAKKIPSLLSDERDNVPLPP